VVTGTGDIFTGLLMVFEGLLSTSPKGEAK
jgi:pyridoxal/pyridoxine/pyridoxamine kinase